MTRMVATCKLPQTCRAQLMGFPSKAYSRCHVWISLDKAAMKKRSKDKQWSSQHMNPYTQQSVVDGRRHCFRASLCHRICGGRYSLQPATDLEENSQHRHMTLLLSPNGAWYFTVGILKPLMIAHKTLIINLQIPLKHSETMAKLRNNAKNTHTRSC